MPEFDPPIGNVRLTRRRFLAYSGLTLTAVACGPAATSSAPSSSGPAPSQSGAAPSESLAPSASPAGGVLRYGQAADLGNLSPWALEGADYPVYNQSFSRLVWKDAEGKESGDLAESWVIAPDGLSIELKLRPGVKWHDGKDFTAQDYLTMYAYLSDPALEGDIGVSKIKALLTPVTAIEAPDATTLVMRFAAPLPYVTDILDYFYAIRIDDTSDPQFLSNLPVGTGPFKMTEYIGGQGATFEANPDYHLPDRPLLDDFSIAVYGGGDNLAPNLLSGTVDGVLLANQAEAETFKDNPDYYVQVNSTGVVWNLEVNCAKAPFDKKEVRQALSYSMNRQAMVDAAHFGLEQPVSSPFFNPGATGYREDLVWSHQFDLDKAKALLDAAGVTDLTIVYPSPASAPNCEVYAVIWQADLKKIGVNLVIEPIDDARWDEAGSGADTTVDVVIWGNGRCSRDGAIFWNTQRNYRGGSGEFSRFGYKSAEMETLVAEGSVETDPARRKEIYQRLNEITVDDCSVINICTASDTLAFAKGAKNVGVDLVGAMLADQATVEA